MSAHMTRVSSSSSEDEAENQRLLDAVWDHTRRGEANAVRRDKSEENSRPGKMIISRPSVREQIYQESYDQFNEDHKNVKATPEFRSFVAKKLSSVLDGKLKMIVANKQKTFHNDGSEETEKDNFRLFSTSCCAPNLNTSEAPVKRKRPRIGRNTKKISQACGDDSDSDAEDERLAEAAISGHQVLSFSAMSASSGHTDVEKVNSSQENNSLSCLDSNQNKNEKVSSESDVEIKDGEPREEFSKISKKKKKKKKGKDTDADINAELSKEIDHADLSEEMVKKKKRKKKRRKVSENATTGDGKEGKEEQNECR